MVYGRTLVMPSTWFFGTLFLGLLLLTIYPCFDTNLHYLNSNIVFYYYLNKNMFITGISKNTQRQHHPEIPSGIPTNIKPTSKPLFIISLPLTLTTKQYK